MKYKCFCCGFLTLNENPEKPTFEICPVCYWENYPYQNVNIDNLGGANSVSLIQAKINFNKYGAMEKKFIKNVRPPFLEEN